MNGAVLLALCSLVGSPQAPRFAHGLPTDPSYFPIAVWLQEPANARKFQAAGFNLYIGLWQGPTEAQLATLKANGMPIVCEQNAVGLAHLNDPTIVGWMHGDEPDNAQEVKDPGSGKTGYGPCIPPSKIVDEYNRMRSLDPSRPVMLNLGQGVANDEWIGRGNGSSLKDYETYVKGGDIVSFDIYPIAGLPKPDPENFLWYVPKGLDRLADWMAGKGQRWNCIECTRIDGERKVTPSQVRSEVWMSLIHGSKGLIYFVHQFKPTFDEHALLDDPEMLEAVTALNAQIHAFAPILNSPTQMGVVSVESASSKIPVDTMVKRTKAGLYLFAVGMRNGETTARFKCRADSGLTRAEVLGENRSVQIVNGQFTDHFSPYESHSYRLTK